MSKDKVPTFKEIKKLRNCLNEDRIIEYASEIRKKIHGAVSDGEDRILLFECDKTETLKIESIKKIMEDAG